MQRLILFLAGFFLVGHVLATGFTPYEWEKSRARFELSAREKAMPELILKNYAEYKYGFENDQFLLQTVTHRIILVNNSEAIQKHNRITIPMSGAIALVDLKARSINKDGKVVLFDMNNLKELKEEESNNAYRIFAIEGIELGSEVEYYFVRKMYPSYFDKAMMQFDVPMRHTSFALHSPKHLKFDFKSYHGFPDMKKEIREEENIYTAEMTDVPAMKEESFSFFEANRKRIEFKLAYNTSRSQARLYTWDDASKRFFTLLNEVDKEEDKALTKLIKTLNDDSSRPMSARIRNVEDKLKSTIALSKKSGDKSLSIVTSILKTNVASNEGMTRLFWGVLTRLNIPCQIVVTCDRKIARFDGTFDTWGYLDDYFLFFPETKGFLAPYHIETRYPLIPATNMGQSGLFIEPIEIGGIKSGLGSIQEIPAADYTVNMDNMDIAVEFDDELTANRVRLKRIFSGYNASSMTPYYHLLTEDQLRALVESVTKQIAPDQVIKKWTAKPLPVADIDQFVIDADFQSTHFIEKAGPNILFKIGELIGPQSELYRDEERITQVENGFNRGYDRIIKVTLPNGYNLRNAKDLNFDVIYKDGDRVPFLFQSSFDIKDGILTVTIQEYYKEIIAPLSRYEDYRKVINAAADFNKVTLVLEKRKAN